MKVILLRDVARIGRRNEIKEVPDGFALNKLIPQKDAIPATPANIKRVTAQQQGAAHAKEIEGAELKGIIATCSAEPLIITMEANEVGHLFRSVHASEVISALKVRGLTLQPQHIQIKQPIKSLGRHEVSVSGGGVAGVLQIEVVTVKSSK